MVRETVPLITAIPVGYRFNIAAANSNTCIRTCNRARFTDARNARFRGSLSDCGPVVAVMMLCVFGRGGYRAGHAGLGAPNSRPAQLAPWRSVDGGHASRVECRDVDGP